MLRDGQRIADGPVGNVLSRDQLEAIYRTTVDRIADSGSGAVAFLPG